MWSFGNLLRLGHAQACRELSDLARTSVDTHPSEDAAELVELAQRLVAQAEDVLELAVASARERGVSWEQIGELLPGADGSGVSRQAAAKRFGERVEQLQVDTLLPRRAPPRPGGLGWTAGPDGVDYPDETVARLDAWALRHREATDPSLRDRPDDQLVSAGLRARYRPAIDSIGPITRLARLLLDATGPFATTSLPNGVTERYARQRLLEFRLVAADAMLEERRSGARGGDPSLIVDRDAILDELVRSLAEDCREQLAFDWSDEYTATVALHARPMVILARNADRRDRETVGWWLWGVGPDGDADSAGGGAWPRFVDVDLQAEREHVEHAAAAVIAADVASDQAKGLGPFAAGGIAGAEPRGVV